MPYKNKEQLKLVQAKWYREVIVVRKQKWFLEHGPCIKCASWEKLELHHKDSSKLVCERIKMAYMRGNWYIYPSPSGIEIHNGPDKHVGIPYDVFNALVIMHVARMDKLAVKEGMDYIKKNCDGNLGALVALGKNPVKEIKKWIKEAQGE